MGKFLLTVLVIALVLFGGWLLFFAGEEEANTTPNGTNNGSGNVVDESVPVTLYYYDPEEDQDATGNIQCSREGLVALERSVTAEDVGERIEQTIELLLQGGLSEDEREAGVTTEFPLEGFDLVDTSLSEDGTLTLVFDDPQFTSSGGSCRAGILWFQIEATALQFDGVDDVRFEPETLFQP